MKNTIYNSSEIKKCCEKKLEIEFRITKECNGWFIINNKKVARITVPKGKKYIPPKTYNSMAKQLLLSTQEFDKLLECSIDKLKYIRIIETE